MYTVSKHDAMLRPDACVLTHARSCGKTSKPKRCASHEKSLCLALDARGRRAYRFAAKINLKSEIQRKIPGSQFPREKKHADTQARVTFGCARRGVSSCRAFPGGASPPCGRAGCGSGR